MFVFSSGRQHTRYWREGGSDVCSSDLTRLHEKKNKPMKTWAKDGHRDFSQEDLKRANRCMKTCSRSEEHTSELQSRQYLVCRLLLENKTSSCPNTRPTPHSNFISSQL